MQLLGECLDACGGLCTARCEPHGVLPGTSVEVEQRVDTRSAAVLHAFPLHRPEEGSPREVALD